MMEAEYFLGVDVGTASARAALTNRSGNILKVSSHPIEIWNDRTDFYEQSSDDIWTACCKVIKDVIRDINPEEVKGIGFDATCSLVVLDEEFAPLTVSIGGADRQNVIMWMDHRASEETARINATRHPVLKYTGGAVSVEMEMPKLLWLKKNLPATWSRIGHVFDLPDFLTWRASGSLSRSLCSLVCKWNYQCHDDKSYWPDNYLTLIGLPDLIENNYSKIGSSVLAPGSPCGSGLTERAAMELGLHPGTSVATSIVDAHAGTLGCLATRAGVSDESMEHRLAVICGTSTCHMVLNEEAIFVSGVWGPYHSAVIPGLWTNEAGQSAAGKLIDHMIETHPSYAALMTRAKTNDRHFHSELNAILDDLAQNEGDVSKNGSNVGFLTNQLHVWPDFHGNRSPVADPYLRGMICGLTLGTGLEELALLYLATIQSLAYGTRHILEVLTSQGHVITSITACGGLSKNPLYVQMHADVTGLPVTLPRESESVLQGAAILASVASGTYPSVPVALRAVNGASDVIQPNSDTESYHKKKYRVFRAMLEHQRQYNAIMEK